MNKDKLTLSYKIVIGSRTFVTLLPPFPVIERQKNPKIYHHTHNSLRCSVAQITQANLQTHTERSVDPEGPIVRMINHLFYLFVSSQNAPTIYSRSNLILFCVLLVQVTLGQHLSLQTLKRIFRCVLHNV